MALRGCLGGGIHFFLEGADELGDEFGRHQLVLEAAEHAGFDRLPRNCLRVAAGAFGAPCGAAIAIPADDRVAAAAAAADQQLA